MVIEFLLIKIREEHSIKCLKHKGYEYKTRAFADDLVFILEDPVNSLLRTIQVINEFGKLAGFYLNQSKSKILLNVSRQREEDIRKVISCEIVNKIKYLGIMITAKNVDLYKNNFEKLWETIDKDIIKWKKLNFSFLGKIAVVKMIIIPKVLFFLQTIPVVKEVKQFDHWQSKINNFIWAGKRV